MTSTKDIINASDEDLVVHTLKNKDFFAYLIERYEAKLASYIKRISGFNKEDVQDILQNVFIKVYTNLNSFDKSLKFSSWIYRITHNEVISLYRKNKNKNNIDIEDSVLQSIVSDTEDIEKILDTKEQIKNVKEALKDLDIKYKEVLVLRFVEDKSYDEISDILKKPPGTVATLINRAKLKLKEKLKDYE